MTFDPIAMAEAAQRALDTLDEMTSYAEPDCGAPAAPDGPAFTQGAEVPVSANRNGTGYAVRVGKKAVAWAGPKGITVAKAYRAALGSGTPIPPGVAKAIQKARDLAASRREEERG